MAIDISRYGEQFVCDYEGGDFENILTNYRKKKFVSLLQDYSTSNMLEIGCGMEPFFLCYSAFESMTVVEPGLPMYESAVKHANSSEKDIVCIHDFVENRVEELKTANFDFILLTGLIHEVEDPDALVETAAQLCSDHTHVLVTTSNPNSFHLTLAYESGIIPHIGVLTDKAKSFQRQSTFTMEQMKELLMKHGFKIEKSGSYFVKPFAHSQMKALLDNHIIDTKVLDGLDAMIKYMPDMGAEIFCIVTKN